MAGKRKKKKKKKGVADAPTEVFHDEDSEVTALMSRLKGEWLEKSHAFLRETAVQVSCCVEEARPRYCCPATHFSRDPRDWGFSIHVRRGRGRGECERDGGGRGGERRERGREEERERERERHETSGRGGGGESEEGKNRCWEVPEEMLSDGEPETNAANSIKDQKPETPMKTASSSSSSALACEETPKAVEKPNDKETIEEERNGVTERLMRAGPTGANSTRQ